MVKRGEIKGQVIKIVSNRYTVKSGSEKLVASARGRLKIGEEIFVGDLVLCEKGKPYATIEEVLPRKNALIRPYVANLDVAIIVVAKEPKPDLLLVDKILLNCYTEGITPVICYNKLDIADKKEIDELFSAYKDNVACIAVSCETGENVDALAPYVKGKVACLAGQSAVGKTSLMNCILDLNLEVGELSARIMRGKNTTRHIEIYEAMGGQIIDTCGFSMLENIDIKADELIYYYDEFVPLQNKCKYHGCLHVNEPDCAVRAAVAAGLIDKGRYERYNTIYNEIKETWEKKYD